MMTFRLVVLAALLALGALGCGAPVADPDAEQGVEPLTVDAGPDGVVVVGETVLLQGSSAGGPEGAERVFSWTIEDMPAGSATSLAVVDDTTASFEPDLSGDYLLRLTVTAGGAEADDTVTITAEPVPDLSPSLAPIADQHTRPGTMLEVSVLLDAPDPAAVTVTATSSDQTLLPDGAIEVLGAHSERWLRLMPVVNGFGVVEVTVVARDEEGREASRSFELVVARLLGVQQELVRDSLAPESGDRFGWAVAISGSRAVVGAPFSDHAGAGAGVAHVYVRSETGWSEVALLAPEQPPVFAGAGAGITPAALASASVTRAGFGSAVGISGDTVVVGAPGHAGPLDPDPGPGRAYVYHRCNPFVTMCPQPYVEDAVLSGDAGERDGFGAAAAVDGVFAAVGAPLETVQAEARAGAAYVYEREGTGWTRVARLMSSQPQENARFGGAVAVSGDRIAVGAASEEGGRGAVYVFERAGAAWNETARIHPSEEDQYARFGFDVDLDGGRLVASAPGDGSSYEVHGPVEVFELSGDTWNLQGLLRPAAGHSPLPFFGHAVAIHGDVVLVGAPLDWDEEHEVGSVTVFTRFDDGWRSVERILPADAPAWGDFGAAVALVDGHAVVGAPHAEPGGTTFALGE